MDLTLDGCDFSFESPNLVCAGSVNSMSILHIPRLFYANHHPITGKMVCPYDCCVELRHRYVGKHNDLVSSSFQPYSPHPASSSPVPISYAVKKLCYHATLKSEHHPDDIQDASDDARTLSFIACDSSFFQQSLLFLRLPEGHCALSYSQLSLALRFQGAWLPDFLFVPV
jgi:hypothetical protein